MENEHVIVNNEGELPEEMAPSSGSKKILYIILPLFLLILVIGALMLFGRNRTPANQTVGTVPITSTQEVLQDSTEDIFVEEPTETIGIVSPTTAVTSAVSSTTTPTPTKKPSPTITLGLQAKPSSTYTPTPTKPLGLTD
jgi:hypothetical protein